MGVSMGTFFLQLFINTETTEGYSLLKNIVSFIAVVLYTLYCFFPSKENTVKGMMAGFILKNRIVGMARFTIFA